MTVIEIRIWIIRKYEKSFLCRKKWRKNHTCNMQCKKHLAWYVLIWKWKSIWSNTRRGSILSNAILNKDFEKKCCKPDDMCSCKVNNRIIGQFFIVKKWLSLHCLLSKAFSVYATHENISHSFFDLVSCLSMV